MTNLTPREIVTELNRFIIGQKNAKKAVAVALRNRWRRMQLSENLQEEVVPKNILMIGPTGVGKTEIARRLAKLANAPFIKVEATKFTEVGYVGRDVEQIIRDLTEASRKLTYNRLKSEVRARAESKAQETIVEILMRTHLDGLSKSEILGRLKNHAYDEMEIEVEVSDKPSNVGNPLMDIPGMPGSQMGMFSLTDLIGGGKPPKKQIKLNVKDALSRLIDDEIEELIDDEAVTRNAIKSVEQSGIVFIDEIDKICERQNRGGADVSREGVQRDLLPLIEGTTVTTKYGAVKTDHILFITSGAFHVSKPADLLPELQGRLPIRVELEALTKNDFVKILSETEANLITQSIALLKTEGLAISFDASAIEAMAEIAEHANQAIENIGARRLHTIIEKLLEEISFNAPDADQKVIRFDADSVNKTVGEIAKSQDLSKFIL